MKIIQIIILILFSNNCFSLIVDKINGSGIDFKHSNGMNGNFYFPEIMGSGVALFDYDNDGDLDLYMVQSGNIHTSNSKFIDQLYRNDTQIQDQPIFVNVTKSSGITASSYGMGVSTGDINNDGYIDVFLTNYGSNQLWLNQKNGKFKELKNSILSINKYWSVSSSLADYNNDGFLDIFVVNYVDYHANPDVKECFSVDESKDYCSPQAFSYQHDQLFLNLGNNKFKDVSGQIGLKSVNSPGLGVVSFDINNDGLLDFYIANDGEPNNLWLNQNTTKFKEVGFISGLSVNMNGQPEASMGVDISDFDNDGDIDIFMTHLNRQTNTLYVNNGKGRFTDLSIKMKIASTSYSYTGFGTIWLDYNIDGFMDLFSANGEVIKNHDQIQIGEPFPFKQSNQLWKNLGNSTFVETTKLQNKNFYRPTVSRGAARGDIDNDGDIDIIVSNNNNVPQIYINENKSKNNWIGFDIQNSKFNRSETHAEIQLIQDKKVYYKFVKVDGSYASSHDNRVLFGLNTNESLVNVKITWRDGSNTKYTNLKLNKYHVLKN